MKITVIEGNEHGLKDQVLFRNGNHSISLSFGLPNRADNEPVTVVSGTTDNPKWFDFPNAVSAMAFVIAELYNVKG